MSGLRHSVCVQGQETWIQLKNNGRRAKPLFFINYELVIFKLPGEMIFQKHSFHQKKASGIPAPVLLPHDQYGNRGIMQDIVADAAEDDRFQGADFRLSNITAKWPVAIC